MVLAAPPRPWWPLGLIAWVPLALIGARRSERRAASLGWLQGTLAQGIALASVSRALHDTAGASVGVALVGTLVLASYEGARFGLLALIVVRARRNGWPLLVSFPVVLALSEWAYPMFFPWSTALFFQEVPVLVQAADLAGTMAISSWAGLMAASLAEAWVRRADRRALLGYAVAVPASTLSAVILYGVAAMRHEDARVAAAPEVRIGIVQGDRTEPRADPVQSVLDYRTASLDLLQKEKVDLLIWPETAIEQPVEAEHLSRFLADHVFSDVTQPVPARLHVPLLAGIVLDRAGTNAGGAASSQHRRYNSAFLATPDGHVRGSYDKRSLVMFGEALPAAAAPPWLRQLLPSVGAYSAGTAPAVLSLADRRILPLICFEDTLAELVRQDVQKLNPDLLVNLTSDAWFGPSRIQDLHYALSKLRAVEHRRFLIHATTTGVTGVIDPTGRVVAELPVHQPASGAASIRWLRGDTTYEKYSGILRALVVVAAAVVGVTRRRARCLPRSSGPDRDPAR